MVIEAGFNAGHSSFNFLTTRRDVVVQSFDIGRHGYVSPMSTFLRLKFPGRLSVVLGDSRLTLPRHFTDTSVNCDLSLVDGGHDFHVALSDIRNLARASSRSHNVMVVDDINSRRVRTAWKLALRSGVVRQLFHCRFGTNGRAFAVGVADLQKNLSQQSKSKTTNGLPGLSCCLYTFLSVTVIFAMSF